MPHKDLSNSMFHFGGTMQLLVNPVWAGVMYHAAGTSSLELQICTAFYQELCVITHKVVHLIYPISFVVLFDFILFFQQMG